MQIFKRCCMVIWQAVSYIRKLLIPDDMRHLEKKMNYSNDLPSNSSRNCFMDSRNQIFLGFWKFCQEFFHRFLNDFFSRASSKKSSWNKKVPERFPSELLFFPYTLFQYFLQEPFLRLFSRTIFFFRNSTRVSKNSTTFPKEIFIRSHVEILQKMLQKFF